MNGYIQGSRSDATRYLVYVLSGALVLLRHTSDGEEVIVHTARSGETLAELRLLPITIIATAKRARKLSWCCCLRL
ncbi:cyclic nucleotide-binding domain-containing protein [Nitratireductor aquibiodomus]|uniref:cyclic nucleotide-binding domain-containing protein n=1 Tax=Nitratireductor aquibiodomus TaxID=204799 RepID=UPI000AF88580